MSKITLEYSYFSNLPISYIFIITITTSQLKHINIIISIGLLYIHI